MRVVTKSPKETKLLGRRIVKGLAPSAVVALFGDLGSGKTVFVKGMACGLGIASKKVVSPTFVLIREYKSRIPLYHFDLYRLKKTDIVRLGFDEYLFGRGITVIEWADRIEEGLPADSVRVKISVLDENRRLIEISK